MQIQQSERGVRGACAAMGAAFLALAMASATYADDNFPPPDAKPDEKKAPIPPEPVADDPESDAAPPADASWSPPAAAPTPPRNLPPPVIRNPRTGRAVTASTSGPRIAPIAPPLGPVAGPRAPRMPPVPGASRTQVPSSPRPVAAAPLSGIESVAKTHNLRMRDGRMALRMDVVFVARRQVNQQVYVGIWFADAAAGKLLSSTLPQYADAAGKLTVQSRPVRVGTDPARYRVSLWLPYTAIPQQGDALDVEARVQLLRRNANRATLLAQTKTLFTAYGAKPDGDGS